MPRPNHDIPNLLLGGVRDYADEKDIDPEVAHAQLLRLALKEVGILACADANGGTVGGGGVDTATAGTADTPDDSDT